MGGGGGGGGGMQSTLIYIRNDNYNHKISLLIFIENALH